MKKRNLKTDVQIPEKDGITFVVAFEKTLEKEGKVYLFRGDYTNLLNKAIRRQIAEELGCNYFDTRVVLLDTYKKRKNSGKKVAPIKEFENNLMIFNSADHVETITETKAKRKRAEEDEWRRQNPALF